ncbi:MAG: glycosyltransferase family 2 protein, partial [Lachnospiraceae bacterium]|nr:glycosyltransferase family 2 protein [Lachnospiraceae bacterium]
MNDPLISVIVPVYNVEKYVMRCIESILAQTYTNLEILLVDDGSTDASGKICDELAKKDVRIRIIHKENGGPSDARNVGIQEARGEYYLFVDSDDWISENLLESMLPLTEEGEV